MAKFELYCKRITQLCGRSVIARAIRYLAHTCCVFLLCFPECCFCNVVMQLYSPLPPVIMYNFGKYVTSENVAASLCKRLGTVCARTQEPKSQRRDFDQGKPNIAAGKSVGPQACRILEVFSSILSPNIGCHE